MKRNLIAILATVAVGLGTPSVTAAQDLPTASARHPLFEPLLPLVGKTWRGTNVSQPGVEDVMRWDWAVAGHAIRVIHAVNGGVYGGETLIFPDKDTGTLIFHYFTTGGFHTTGTARPGADGGLAFEEAVHGADGIENLRSIGRFVDGGYQTRAVRQEADRWVEFGGFDYVEAPGAEVALPNGAAAPATQAALELSRMIVADPGEPGHDAAGYLRVRAASGADDALTAAACDCAQSIQFHRIVREGGTVDMVADPVWTVPAEGALEVRPGSDLHMMLIGFDPSKAVDGRVMLRLTFRDAGVVQVPFVLARDSRAAWAAGD